MFVAYILSGILALGVAKPNAQDDLKNLVPSTRFFSQGFHRDCDDGMACTLNVIHKHYAHPSYKVEIRVEDTQTKAIVCVLEVDLEPLASDVLRADDGEVSMMLERTGDIVINGLVEDECSGADVNGRYAPQVY